jgi:hypothetical protein
MLPATVCNYYKHKNRYVVVITEKILGFGKTMCHSDLHGTSVIHTQPT